MPNAWEQILVNVRIITSMVMQGCSEIIAYGTAVKIK